MVTPFGVTVRQTVDVGHLVRRAARNLSGPVRAAFSRVLSRGAARMMRRELPSVPVMGAVFGLGGLLLMPVLLVTGGPVVAIRHGVAVVLYLALVPMFLGYVLFGRGLAAVSASTATTLSLIEPAVAAAIAVIVLGERLPVLAWVGMATLLASLVPLTVPTRQAHDGRAASGRAEVAALVLRLDPS